MKKHEADKLIEVIRSLAEDAPKQSPKVTPPPSREDYALSAEVKAAGNGHALPKEFNAEKLYQAFKARIIDEAQFDPILVKLLMVQPEMIVEYERKVVTLDGTTLKGRVARLIAGGWFAQPKTTAATRKELARIGSDPSGNDNLRKCLADYRAQGFVTEEAGGWQVAPGVKVSERAIEA